MSQHPKVTVGWAMNGLEDAIRSLGSGPAERRVRDQFHQLLLAIERDAYSSDVQRLCSTFSGPSGAAWPRRSAAV